MTEERIVNFQKLSASVRAGLFTLFAAFLLSPAPSAQAAPATTAKTEVTIGLVDTFLPSFYTETYAPTLDYLIEKLPQFRFHIVEINYQRLQEDIARLKPAFLVSSASTFISLIETQGAHQVATKQPVSSENVARTVASTFIVRADSPIQTLMQAKGHSVAGADSDSFDGWIIALGEIARQNGDADQFFSTQHMTRYGIPDVAMLVKSGFAEVGILSTCEYENLLKTGEIKPGDFRLINLKETAPGTCARSTDQYPDVVFSSLPSVSSDITREVTVALLSMPANKLAFRWTIANDFLPTYDLLKTLHVPPYERPELTLAEIWSQWRTEILLFLGLALAVLFHIITINQLVQRRTSELRESLAETSHFYEQAQKSNAALALLERMNIVSQLSGMFAHEIKQPLMNISLYAGALKMLLNKEQSLGPDADSILAKITREIDRSTDIVNHVRSYAKQRTSSPQCCDLEDIAAQCIREFSRDNSVQFEAQSGIRVMADPFELRFVIANFLKNAKAATELEKKPQIRVRVFSEDGNAVVSVTDNGPEISDESFKNLGKIVASSKPDGLGLGLAIAVAIVEKIPGHITFERIEPHGLEVRMVLALASEEHRQKEEPDR